VAAEHAGEAAVGSDGVEHLSALTHADTPPAGDRRDPDRGIGVGADPVGGVLERPDATIGQRSVAMQVISESQRIREATVQTMSATSSGVRAARRFFRGTFDHDAEEPPAR
jgi:hypothetical protein